MKKFSFNCVLIGEGNLLIECAEILIRNNHHIKGIISHERAIALWAKKHNLLYCKNFQQFKQRSPQARCNYIFSIVNHTILNQEFLELADLAINYHDALLPTYAGVNATSLAIINGEQQHGISWHEMNLKVDTGKILKQVKIKLEPTETALTLNAKCYQAAIVSFPELIEELATQKITTKSQDLQQRSYCARYQKPPALGIIDFNNPAIVIDNLVRGLDFGNYPNPLATAKLLLNSNSGLDYAIVTKVKVLTALSSRSPGTIVEITKQQLIVATSSHNIALETIVNQQNQTQSIAELVANYQLQVGQKLPEIDAKFSAELVELASKIAPSETYWLKQLSKCRQLSFPFEQIPGASVSHNNLELTQFNKFSPRREANPLGLAPPILGGKNLKSPIFERGGCWCFASLSNHAVGGFRGQVRKSYNYRQVKLPLSSIVTNLLRGSLEVTITAFAIYLARLSNNNCISLGFERHTKDPWFARYIPCNLKLELEQNFTSILETVTHRLRLNHKHQTYLSDIITRYPQLAAQQTSFSVAVTEIEQNSLPPANLASSYLILIIDRQKAEYFWSYNTQVFTAQTIETMIEQWTILLEAIASDSQCHVSQLPLISAGERQKILSEWNYTDSYYPQKLCLHQLFEAKAAENPQAVALVCQQEHLTYGELEQKANQLARYLQSLGVGAETLVGVCLDRSLEMIVALFAILKAGGAYLPLDPNYPLARLTYLVEDSGIEILLTQSKLSDRIPNISAQIVCLDRDWQNIVASNNNLVGNVNSHNLAYTIYTSGSTGNPKGVEIEHHSVVNTLYDIEQRFKVNSQDRILAVSSLSFDLSVYDIFGVLGSGGRVIIPQPENCPNPEHWLELIVQEQVTIWNSAPALMELLLDYIVTNKQTLPPSLRLVLLSGDRISPNLVIGLQNLNPQLQIISLGGATEASIWSIYYPIKNLADSAKTIPYGRPLNNQAFYILDRELQLMPIGAIGELYIGGVGVARGYLHREQLTASKFLRDPFSDSPARLYKTGDLGRYLEDGNIEFLGRIDNQVKIRGVRVELGEIEATLLQYPEIRETLVAISSNHSEQTSIIAYCVLKSKSVTSRELRDFLKTKLPEYAVPTTFVFLDALPLTPNGKVDRQALLQLPISQPETENNFLPPQDRLEWQLSQIWSRILNVQPIGRDDNFFELGGSSLLALRLFEQIQNTFGKNLPLATLFQAPTIAQLAHLMLERGWSASWSSLVSIQPHGNQSPLFCIHAAGGNVLGYHKLATALGTERPIYGLQARGLDGKQTPLTSIEEMASSYLEEIKLVQPRGPYFMAGHSFGGFVAFEMAQQLSRQGETVAVLALFDCFGPNGYDKSTFPQRLSIHLNNLSELSFREKLAYFTDRFEYALQSKIPWSWQQKYLKLINLMSSPEQKLISQIQNLNFQANQRYTPTVYEGKLTLFRARVRQAYGYFDPYGGWQGIAMGGIDIDEIPGSHTSLLLKSENSQILAEKLKPILANFTDRPQCEESAKIRQVNWRQN